LADPGFYRHETAIVESASIGAGTRIWAYAHVLPGAVIGAGCNICDQTFIENEVRLGDRVTIKCGVQLWDWHHVGRRRLRGPQRDLLQRRVPAQRAAPGSSTRALW
jgi:acyl-[acyl carrier protein]--UDP-N-acetylglucosamine O-acyltransferase